MRSRILNLLNEIFWRSGLVLLALLLIGCTPFVVLLLITKVPIIFCEWRRNVNWVFPVAFGYYSLVVLTVYLISGDFWPSVAMGIGASVWCFQPDPVTFVFSPQKRRAVYAAIRFQERSSGIRPSYGRVSILATEPERFVVEMELSDWSKPPGRKFVAVSHDGVRVDELDFASVADKYDVPPRLM
jgi:hypothetical protein